MRLLAKHHFSDIWIVYAQCVGGSTACVNATNSSRLVNLDTNNALDKTTAGAVITDSR